MPRRNRRAIAAPPLSNGVRHPSPVAVARIIHSGGAAHCSEFERAPYTASRGRHGGGVVGLRHGGSLEPPKFVEHKLHPAPLLSSNKSCVPTNVDLLQMATGKIPIRGYHVPAGMPVPAESRRGGCRALKAAADPGTASPPWRRPVEGAARAPAAPAGPRTARPPRRRPVQPRHDENPMAVRLAR